MDLHLAGKTALLTASSSGIGLATAATLAAEGATVVLNGRDKDRLHEAQRQLLDQVPEAAVRLVVADVGIPAGVQTVIDAEPRVDILINNVALYHLADFADLSDADWTAAWNVNVLSGIRLARHYLPGMLERNDGRIILLGTDAAVLVSSAMMHYEVTKAATLALARGLADLTRGTAVTVNSVLPGPTSTEGMNTVLDTIAAQAGATREDVAGGLFAGRPASLLQRLATAQEVANLITYLASPRSAATNGAAVRVEGGTIPTVL
ncbi:SDR family NAD(P)-dependent oxidoreductase [Mycolicibacterium sp.]|uniref:SDR family NAD(P)-dependent oxidoreductase n=1 Tax=Mycolicibacterium sp. TaxID=2320850 RepID=UPI003D113D56